jgi:4'-phosphopantetheinyl transferase
MATIELAFQPSPLEGAPPPLAANAIHVWRLQLHDMPETLLLAREEEERAARMRHEPSRHVFLHTRTMLRRILALYTGRPAEALPIVISEQGKPSLKDENAPCFNLSHSGQMGLIAITRAAPVGVDLEMLRDVTRPDRIAKTYFTPSEQAALASLPESQQLDAFHACWTRKEAYVKATGKGIANQLASFDVTLLPDQPAQICAIDGHAQKAQATTLHAFRPRHDAWAAVCALCADMELLGFEPDPG